MSAKRVTLYVVIATVVGLIVFDFWAYSEGGTEATVSHLIIVAAQQSTPLAFASGFLCGHFFWPTRLTDKLKEVLKQPENKG